MASAVHRGVCATKMPGIIRDTDVLYEVSRAPDA